MLDYNWHKRWAHEHKVLSTNLQHDPLQSPPARRGPRQAPRNVQCHASEDARGPSVASKSRGLLIPVPFPLLPSLQGFPNNVQLFGVRLSTGWLTIPHIGERRQDVYRPARTRIHPSQPRRRLPAKKGFLSTTTHSARRTSRSRAVCTGKLDGLLPISP
jgi:hypothetical protein